MPTGCYVYMNGSLDCWYYMLFKVRLCTFKIDLGFISAKVGVCCQFYYYHKLNVYKSVDTLNLEKKLANKKDIEVFHLS